MAVDHDIFKRMTKEYFLKLINKNGYIYDLKKCLNKIVKKKISCILPINKDLKYIDQSIGSILDQTYKNFELIIISNTSNEMINKKIFHYKKRQRVKVFKKTKGNLSELLNYGISKAQGDFIARQDSDDISNKKI